MGYYWSPYWVDTTAETVADIRGRPLRYLLVTILADAQSPISVQGLIGACAQQGVSFSGRPSKIISDALRWEVRSGRVRRLSRGVYALGRVPKSTMRWIGHRVTQLKFWLQWANSHDRRSAHFEPSADAPYMWHWQEVSWVPGWPCWPVPEAQWMQTSRS